MPDINAQAIRVPKTAELVAAQLRRRIVRGELVEDDALPPESQLMEEFGVSRPTLREAFRVLESESLIVIRRGARGGARVRSPDVGVAARYAALLLQVRDATLKDVYEARLIVEPAAAGMLAKRRTKSAIAGLRAALAEEEEHLDDQAAHAASAVRFHETLVQVAGNTTLAVLAGMLHEIVEQHIALATARDAARGPESIRNRNRRRGTKAHARLLELIEAGDDDEAVRFWRVHMEAAGHLLLRGVGARTVVDLMG